MALSRRDKQGVVILIALFIVLGVALAIMWPRPLGEPRDFSESVFVQQRIINLEKNR